MLYLPPLLVVGLQIACAVHAIRHGRTSTWLWLILFFPLIGSIIYVVSEVRIERAGRNVVEGVLTAVAPTRRLKELREQLAHCDTVENRMALAAESLAQGLPEEAIQLYESCREGVFKDDPAVLMSLAEAYLDTGAHAKAQAAFEDLFRVSPRHRTVDRRLLLARALQGQGNHDAALAEYEEIAGKGTGDEARCRYALLLEKVGRGDEAQPIFARILADAKRSPAHYRRANRRWIRIAEAHRKSR